MAAGHPEVLAATRLTLRRADAVTTGSEHLGQSCAPPRKLPGRKSPSSTAATGSVPWARRQSEAQAELGWRADSPNYLLVGSLEERKTVRRLVEAFERLEHGNLALVGRPTPRRLR